MWVFKVWYLLYFASSSCLYPFFNVIFRRNAGLSESQLGVIAALRPWIGLPAGGAFSGVADKWHVHRAVLLLTFVLSSVGRLAVAGASSFGAILSIMLFADAFASPVTIIVDAATMAACPKQGEYARQRLYGAVGWGVFAFVAGSAIKQLGISAAFVLNAVLGAATLVPTALLPFEALNAKLDRHHGHQHADGGDPPKKGANPQESSSSSRGPNGPSRHAGGLAEVAFSEPTSNGSKLAEEAAAAAALEGGGTGEQPAREVHFWRGMAVLASQPEAVVFFCMAGVYGYAVGSIEGFLFLYLEDLGGSEALMGLTLSVTCVAEAAVFYWTGTIINALGLDACFHICFAAFLLRLGSYASLAAWGSPWLVLPVELLHGLTFGLTWSAGTAKCAQVAPPGLEATTQSVFQGLLFGLGHGVGGLVGGRIYHSLGPRVMYGVAMAVVAGGWAATSAARAVVRRGEGGRGGRGPQVVAYSQVPALEMAAAQ